MTKLTPLDITPGESWACRFRTTTFLDSKGQPITARLNIGEAHPGTPGEYTSLGVIRVRDTEKRMLLVVDTRSTREFAVSWDDCWDIDRVEYED